MREAIRNFRLRTVVLLSVMLVASAFAYAVPVAAAPLDQAGTGTITGQVLSADNVPLPNVRLAAYAQAPGTPNRTQLAALQSDAQGRYSVQVPAGTVWMEFLTQDIGGQSFWGYSNLPVNVAAGQTIGDQNFVVAIRIVSEPQAPAAPAPPASSPVVGMPRTGAGPDMWAPLGAVLGMLMILTGMVQRRRAPR